MSEKHDTKLSAIVAYFNGAKHLAAELDVTTTAVGKWLEADALPPARAIQVERMSKGKFKAVDLV